MRKLIAALLSLPCLTWATSCSYPPPCNLLSSGSVVFIGTVVGYGPPEGAVTRTARVRVEEPFAGVPPGMMEVRVGAEFLEAGERYLVDGGMAPNGMVWPAICGQTAKLNPNSENVRYLRGVAAGKDRRTSTYVRLYEDFEPMKGVQVELRGPGGVYRSRTNVDGVARFRRVRPGHYSLVQLPAHHVVDPDHPTSLAFDIHQGSCAGQILYLRGDGAVSGRLVTQDGGPLAGAVLELIGTTSRPTYKTATAPDGTFRFTAVSTATFRLGTSVKDRSDLPQWFYGGNGHPTEIPVGPGSEIKGVEFQVPNPGARRRFVFRAVDEVGQPIPGAALVDKFPALDANYGGLTSDARTDVTGELVIEGWANVAYGVRAFFENGPISRWKQSEVVLIPPGTDPLRFELHMKPVLPAR